MIFLDTKLYLRYTAKKHNVKYSKSLLDALYYYIDIAKDNGYRLDFHWWRHASFKALNCNAGYGRYSSIVATPGWAAKLVLNGSEEIHLN